MKCNDNSNIDNLHSEHFNRKNHYIDEIKTDSGTNCSGHDDSLLNKDRKNKLTVLGTYFYFPVSILWMETVLKLSADFSVFNGMLFTVIFTVPFAIVLTLVCTFSKSRKVNRLLSMIITGVLGVWYAAQLVYFNVFKTFFVISSIINGGTGQALNSVDMIMTAVFSRIGFIVLMFLPLSVNIIFGKKLFEFQRFKISLKLVLIAAAVIFQVSAIALICFDSNSSNAKSNYNLYYGELQQNAVCERFGIFTMQRLDISRLIFGYKTNIRSNGSDNKQDKPATVDSAQNIKAQIIDTDFENLCKNTDNKDLKSLYSYFNNEQPSYTNKYTGMFKDYNIVFITAESFSQYVIDKHLTPTLYKMYSEGFQFDNYYSPAWGVSTTDGEYANLTGLIPKSGVWSFSQSAEQNVSFPFSLGEQSRRYNYEKIKAYHNHTYDYYDRDKYLANIGYDYKAIGKGLDLGEDVWPNSDLKMIQKTITDYINADSFSVYYMTVSGHGGYSYNTISERNWDLVKNLNYSDEVKGYIAANIELDKAVGYLIGELKKAKKLDNTLICITDDHYPYSLDEFNGLDELAGHKVDSTFERYKNSWLLWSSSMKAPVKVDTYCSSIDILPTMLNMLGFEYDSRTIAGSDVFGEKEPFVVFADRSWISQNGKYNANSDEYTVFKNAGKKDDIDELKNKCTNMFSVSRMILDFDAYANIYGDMHNVKNTN